MFRKNFILFPLFFICCVALMSQVKADEPNKIECYYGENKEFEIVYNAITSNITAKYYVPGRMGGRYSTKEPEYFWVSQEPINKQSDAFAADGSQYKCPEKLYVSYSVSGIEYFAPTFDPEKDTYDGLLEPYEWHTQIIDGDTEYNSKFVDTVPPNDEDDGDGNGDGNGDEDILPGEPIKCEDFDSSSGNLINEIFTIITIASSILLIILGTIDFARASLASDEQALKKAGGDFGKRIIAAILLFILPVVLNLLIGIAHDIGIFEESPMPPIDCVE